MSGIKGLGELKKRIHEFKLSTIEDMTLEFSLREPTGIEETVRFIKDFSEIEKLNTESLNKVRDLLDIDEDVDVDTKDVVSKLSLSDKLDLMDDLFEQKFTFCVKWLKELSIEDVTEQDCIKAYELVKDKDELFINIIKASAFGADNNQDNNKNNNVDESEQAQLPI